MIGWPEFQTKDGKVYPRAWAPGSGRVPPRRAGRDDRDRPGHAHGAAARRCSTPQPPALPTPAPETEYILVSAVEPGGQAWVEISAGIDVNPAALSLA